MAAPYPLLSGIISEARIIVNDAIQTAGGNTLTDTADFTPIYANHGWRQFQQDLLSFGYVRFRVPNLLIPGLPPVNNEDVSLQVFLNWYGYYDGVNTDSSILLPSNLIRVLKASERPSDQAPNLSAFIDMDGPEQGIKRIPSVPKSQWNGLWVWNDDAMWMPGALVATDLRLEYAAYLPNFTSGAGFPGTQTADIMRCEDALSGYIAGAFCAARGDIDAGAIIMAKAKDATRIIAGILPSDSPPGVIQ